MSKKFDIDSVPVHEAINWNNIEDPKDLEIWNRLVQNFWVPEAVNLAGDIPSWNALTDEERLATTRVLTTLTQLDSIQGRVGAISLMPSAITPHEEAVYTNIAFMERFAGGTQLLTPNGWKNIENITLNDKVLQYNPETNEMTFVSPTRVYNPEFRDEIYEISSKNGNAKQVVSGGHRVYYEEKEQLDDQCNTWVGQTDEAREIPGVNLASPYRRFRVTGTAASGTGMTSKDKLLAAITVNGYYDILDNALTDGTAETVSVSFSLPENQNAERLQQLAEETGWELSEATSDNQGSPQRKLELNVPVELSETFRKNLTQLWNLETISKEWAQDFVSEISLWGSCTEQSETDVTFKTAVKEDSDFVIAVASFAGYTAQTSLQKDDNAGTGQSQNEDLFVTTINLDQDTVSSQSVSVTKVEGAMTYCVQVPSTYLLTRHSTGSTPVISGNCIHAKSYSSIFSTLLSTREIDETFEWAKTDYHTRMKSAIILHHYNEDDHEKRKIISTLLESFLFYSGFFMPLWWSSNAKLTNTADIIRLIIRDESIHGYYIGYKFQKAYEASSPERQKELYEFTLEALGDLFENEERYTEAIYDPIGLTEEVKTFLKYNANKALMNLGFEALYSKEETDVIPQIMASLNPAGEENHDFFSGTGNYIIGTTEETEDDDWDF